MLRLALTAFATTMLSGIADAASYTDYTQYSAQQLNFTSTADPTAGYNDFDTTLSVTNTGTSSKYLYYVATTLLLNSQNALWSSSQGVFTTGTVTAQPISSHVTAAYEEVAIPEPQPAGYLPGGTIPLYTVGLVGAGSTVTFDVIRKTNASSINTGFRFVALAASVPEPATWFMMIAGFGAIGAFMRSRKIALSFA